MADKGDKHITAPVNINEFEGINVGICHIFVVDEYLDFYSTFRKAKN